MTHKLSINKAAPTANQRNAGLGAEVRARTRFIGR
jgi:hypothetical protein